GGSGNNFVNTVIDDQASGDLLTAVAASAPFTGSWKPMFNASSWDGALGLHDPIGLLSRYNGLSTKGDWKVLVSDQFQTDTGTLNSWSLIVTPKAFTVTPFLGTAASFVGGPTNGAAPLTVSFTNLSTSATNYSWNFGDGKTSTATNAA